MDNTNSRAQRYILVVIGCFLGIAMSVLPAGAAEMRADVVIDADLGKSINLSVNKLAKLKSSRMIARSLVVNPEIAEIFASTTQSPNWVFISGKSVGTTQLTLWDKNNSIIGTYEVIVSLDLTELKKTLHEIFPGENIEVRSSGEHLTLTGTVTSAEKLPKILELAQAYVPTKDGQEDKKGKIINLLQVGGVQQVMLEVRIAEISKTISDQLGVNFAIAGSDAFGLSLLDNLTAIPDEGWPGNPILLSNSINAALGFISGDTILFAVDALQEDGLLQILAKPTLIAQSGQSASFLAGGEFPYPVASSFDRFAIEWKPFGIGLNFTPTVLGNDTISLLVSPEVSELDFTNTVSFAGYTVPSIDTRRMSTVVELKDNQSFAIAGLLKDYVRESIKKFPLLGDLPILGALFRSTRYQKDETELLVIITPHLVKPADAATLPLPTDSFEDPTPFEILMLGMMEKWHDPERQAGNPSAQTGARPAMEGGFGYIIPE
ncbi:MAG TPA: pilus assembly protein CpaC [Desulfobulbaceae bacterium]|nr:pilus assembly protein CpaC [Desulfobulbaceae bacterium]